MKEVFVINGYPGSGKTTFGKLVGQQLAQEGISFIHTSSIDPIKHLLRPISYWDPEMVDLADWNSIETIKRKITPHDWDGVTKNVYWRGVMSQFKYGLMAHFPDMSHQFVMNNIDQLPVPKVGFVDIREPENIASFRQFCSTRFPEYDFHAVFVRCNLRDAFDNPSDAGVEDYPYDIYVDNQRNGSDSMENLKHQVDIFCLPIIRRVQPLEIT